MCALLSCTQSKFQTIPKQILLEKLTEIDADSGLVLIVNNEGNIVTKINLVLNNGEYKEGSEQIFNTPREIGSLFTPASMLIALKDNVVIPTDTIDVGEGALFIEEAKITDHNYLSGGYGKIIATEVISYNSNVGISKIILNNYNRDRFIQSVENIGFDITVNDMDLPWLSLGYGVNATPVSIVSFYHDIAQNKKGSDIQNMLIKTVKEGTGKPVDSDLVNIAGKTGSINSDNKIDVTFCGYFPVENPKYTCLVIISNPKKGSPSGGLMTGDVVKKIAEAIL